MRKWIIGIIIVAAVLLILYFVWKNAKSKQLQPSGDQDKDGGRIVSDPITEIPGTGTQGNGMPSPPPEPDYKFNWKIPSEKKISVYWDGSDRISSWDYVFNNSFIQHIKSKNNLFDLAIENHKMASPKKTVVVLNKVNEGNVISKIKILDEIVWA